MSDQLAISRENVVETHLPQFPPPQNWLHAHRHQDAAHNPKPRSQSVKKKSSISSQASASEPPVVQAPLLPIYNENNPLHAEIVQYALNYAIDHALIDFGISWKEGEDLAAKKNDLWVETPEKMYFEVSTGPYRAPELLSLDTVRDKWEERARAEAALDGRSLQRTPTFLKRHTFSASLPPHIVATPLSPNTTGISVENPDSPTNSFSTPTHHRIRLPTAASLHSSSLPDIKELADNHAPAPISLDSPSPPTRRPNTLDSNALESAVHDPASRIADPFTPTAINNPSSPSKPLFAPATPTTIRRRPTSLYGSQFSSFPFPEKEPLAGRISAGQDLTDHTLRLPSRVSRVSDHNPSDLTSKLTDLPSRISAYTSRFDTHSSDSTSSSISPTVPPIVDRTSRTPDITTRVAEYTSRLNPSERMSPSPTHTPTSSFASTQNSFTSASSSTPPHTPSSSTTSIPSTSSSVMSPAPYRSSYMSNKKSSTYRPIAGHKLGHHLPRIASGDAGDDWVDEQKPNPPLQSEHIPIPVDDSQVVSRRARRNSRYEPPASPITEELVAGMPNASDVAGIPGRLRLSRDQTPASPTAPTTLPSSRLRRGLWADVQRHLLQAYEYLCHVGEAQQWIEGCLGEELGFGVVEMEEGMRNGVVLARLVRVFKGEGGFRIYEARKLNFRHSDNINHFFVFVREVGLPEGFIFELTDLYEKKNFPQVITAYTHLGEHLPIGKRSNPLIPHSHLLARRGLAECIGDLLGQLQFSDDQLQKTQKGLTDVGIPMPNFGNIGRELAKEINEEPDPPPPPEPEESEEECCILLIGRDRLLLENEDSIRSVQCLAHGFLVRKALKVKETREWAYARALALFAREKQRCIDLEVVERREQHRRTEAGYTSLPRGGTTTGRQV
ncbi:hypothetical protein P692DRAFT_20866468 [Suillus brevipes Sb2]|nr:hypothetical protein P692DRAFT_20866468 [Suillus brevipes Sb2]